MRDIKERKTKERKEENIDESTYLNHLQEVIGKFQIAHALQVFDCEAAYLSINKLRIE